MRDLRPETAASFEAARAALRALEGLPSAKDDPEIVDRARSAAERFLFDLLGDLPETAGLFELNARLGFCFGPMPAEVDLLAGTLRLAVEIDGFHHFRDPEGLSARPPQGRAFAEAGLSGAAFSGGGCGHPARRDPGGDPRVRRLPAGDRPASGKVRAAAPGTAGVPPASAR